MKNLKLPDIMLYKHNMVRFELLNQMARCLIERVLWYYIVEWSIGLWLCRSFRRAEKNFPLSKFLNYNDRITIFIVALSKKPALKSSMLYCRNVTLRTFLKHLERKRYDKSTPLILNSNKFIYQSDLCYLLSNICRPRCEW